MSSQVGAARSARYVRLRSREGDLARLRAAAPKGSVVHEDGALAFVAVLLPSAELEPADLSGWSRDFGEVIALSWHSVADLVVYDHWRDGARTRGLTHAGEAGWLRVAGEPEAWEAALLFTDAKLEALLEDLESDLSDPATIERETTDLRRVFAAKRLEEGHVRPAPDLPALLRTIEKHYGLPTLPKKG